MSIGERSTFKTSVRGYSTRRLAPMVETVESRQMLAAGFGVIAGTAFIDLKNNDTLDPADPYLTGATIQLFQVGNPTSIASQTTGATGGYSFTGLAPGNYLVSETPPANAQVSGTQVLSQVEPTASVAGNLIQVTVPATPLYLNYNGVLPGHYQVTNDVVDGTATTDSIGPFQVSLGSTLGATDVNPGFLSYCLDDLRRLSFGGGEQFQVNPLPITSAANGTATISADRAGRIAFLFNHFGNASLNNIQGPALQLAIWELLYDTNSTPDFTSGNFQVTGPDQPFTDQTTLNQVLAQATTYFNMSAGKSESAILLDASPSQTPGQLAGSQSMIAEGSFNFANQPFTPVIPPTPSSLAGVVYCDANHDGTYDSGDMPIAGALMALTGTDQTGKAIKLTTISDATGAYLFPNLNPGTYSIALLTAPTGLIPANDSQGTPGNGIIQTNRIVNIALPAGLNGMNNDFGLNGQAVSATQLQLLGIHQQTSQIVLQFNGPLNATAAQDPANYSLIGLGKDETYGTADDVRYRVLAATYNPSNATVTLLPSQHLNIHYHYVLQFNLPGVNPCAPAVTSTSVFGRTAVPYFNIHGTIKPNPPLTAAEVQHNAQVVARTLAKLGQTATPATSHVLSARSSLHQASTARVVKSL